jgi:dihydrofolate reductase
MRLHNWAFDDPSVFERVYGNLVEIESALAKAQEVAGDKRIGLMGANIDQLFLAAGLVDEIRIHVVDVLLGGGRRLFDQLPRRIELEQTGLSQTGGVTHLEYCVLR